MNPPIDPDGFKGDAAGSANGSAVTVDERTWDTGPSRLTQVTAIALACLASLGLGGTGLAVSVAGVVILTLAVLRGRGGSTHIGGLVILAGIAIAGMNGAALEPVLLSTVSAIVAWDIGRYGIAVGQQLGRSVETTRIEVVHTLSSAVVGVIVLLLMYGLTVFL